jgi:DNA-directed RNA polymerase subunit K/omega
MDKDINLRLLDKFDKDENIYELICKLAEKAHSVIDGRATSVEIKESSPIQTAMAEFLSGVEKAGE